MSIKAFVIFLSLENVYQISTLDWNGSDIMDFIFSLLFVIGRVRNFELSLVSGVIDLHEAKLGEAMLKTYTIESYRSYLDSHWTFIWSSCINLLEEWFFYYEFLGWLASVLVLLLSLLKSELCNFEWSQNSGNWNSQWVQGHKLALMAIKFKCNSNFRLAHTPVLFLTI